MRNCNDDGPVDDDDDNDDGDCLKGNNTNKDNCKDDCHVGDDK